MRQQIASAINVVIQVSRLGDGTRKLIQISEIVGMEGDVITMQDIFIFERQGIGENEQGAGAVQGHRASGPSSPTGSRPTASTSPAMLFSNLGERPAHRAGGSAPMVDLPRQTWVAALLMFLAVALGTHLRRAPVRVGPGAAAEAGWRCGQLREFASRRSGRKAGSWCVRRRAAPLARAVRGPGPGLPGSRSDDGAGRTSRATCRRFCSCHHRPRRRRSDSAPLIVTRYVAGGAARGVIGAALALRLRPPAAEQADVRLRGAAARGHRPARPRDARRPPALRRVQDGGGRDARSRSRASSGGPTRSTGSGCPSRTRCSPWPTG